MIISSNESAAASSNTLSNTITMSKIFIEFLFIFFAVHDIIEMPPQGGREISLPLGLATYRLSLSAGGL